MSSASSVQSGANSQGNSSFGTFLPPGTKDEDVKAPVQVLWRHDSTEVISDGDDTLERKAAVAQERKSATYRTVKVRPSPYF